MNEVKLNLARKWRSKQFDEIIGQDLSIRMLKNSLYLQQYFPVYLFSGQRGCGKTTTARVFAASLNCECLPLFQKNPQKQVLPCLTCDSCKAMELGKHPDFIEIDAASHTGVDNIRMLIDSASLLPLMGRKKIYLIDEAHMLSKAAFNALLKILEEPPISVIFILATTDPQKIIETVHSRCFQLFFRSVDMEVLHARLRDVCLQENINFDQEGLSLIIKQTDGSVRDALNLLEQVRFSSKEVTQKAVLDVLGFIDDAALLTLFERVLSSYQKDVLQFISDLGWHHYSAHLIWVRLLELIRAALWIKHDVVPALFTEHHAQLRSMVSKCTVRQLIDFLQIMYDQELLFTKTTAKHDFIEMVLLQMCQRVNQSNSDSGTSSSSNQAPIAADSYEMKEDSHGEDEDMDEQDDVEDEETITARWKQFVTKVEALNDPLIHSIFTQGIIKQSADDDYTKMYVEFSKELGFFSDLLEQTKSDWQPLLHDIFGAHISLVPLFTGASRAVIKKTTQAIAPQQPVVQSETKSRVLAKTQQVSVPYPKKSLSNTKHGKHSSQFFATDKAIDIADTKLWHKTHLILRYVPGTVTEIRE